MKKISCYTVFLAIFFAIITIFFLQKYPGYSDPSLLVTDFLGNAFLRLLTILVIPLVCSSIISSIGKLGSEANLKKVGLKTAIFYFGTTLIALFIGVFLVNLLQPGSAYQEKIANMQKTNLPDPQILSASYFLDTLLPKNFFTALVEGKMLSLIFFSIAIGVAITKLEKKHRETLVNFFEAIFQMMIRLSSMVLKILPLGIYCLSVQAFSNVGYGSLQPLFLFSLTVILGLALFMFVFVPLVLRLYAKIDPILYLKAMSPALVTAFTTSSSSASIPITIDCIEKNVGVSKKIAHLIIPLGISINLSGSALYECVAALFVAQAYGLDLSITTQFAVVLLALCTSMGVAGIPGGSLVATIIILEFLGLPAEGISLFIAVERLMDMVRTTANIYGDGACAVLVAASEGERAFFPKKIEPECS